MSEFHAGDKVWVLSGSGYGLSRGQLYVKNYTIVKVITEEKIDFTVDLPSMVDVEKVYTLVPSSVPIGCDDGSWDDDYEENFVDPLFFETKKQAINYLLGELEGMKDE